MFQHSSRADHLLKMLGAYKEMLAPCFSSARMGRVVAVANCLSPGVAPMTAFMMAFLPAPPVR